MSEKPLQENAKKDYAHTPLSLISMVKSIDRPRVNDLLQNTSDGGWTFNPILFGGGKVSHATFNKSNIPI